MQTFFEFHLQVGSLKILYFALKSLVSALEVASIRFLLPYISIFIFQLT
jgi:hypothetical protein